MIINALKWVLVLINNLHNNLQESFAKVLKVNDLYSHILPIGFYGALQQHAYKMIK